MNNQKSIEKILYQEIQKGLTWVWLLAGVFFAIATARIGFIYLLPLIPRAMLAIPIGLIVWFIFLLMNFAGLKIVITKKHGRCVFRLVAPST